MSSYTRRQVVEILEVEEGFLVSLEREEISATHRQLEELAARVRERLDRG